MVIKGAIEDVIFYNEQNGYTVIKVSSEGRLFTCVGNMPVISVGEEVELEGCLANHQKYGEQFVVQNFTVNAPTSREGIVRYLSSGLIKGIGEITAKKIYDAFGKDSMKVLESQPERLASLKGITPAKAEIMSECYNENKKMQNQIMFLQGYNISLNTAIKIYNVYKDATKEVVKENPYRLIDDIDGIGFISADKIARNMGLDEDSPFRFRAAIVYSLKESAEKQGNTYLTYQLLRAGAEKVLRLELGKSEIFDQVLDRLILDAAVKDFSVDGERRIALTKFYNTEKQIAAALIRLSHEAASESGDADELIAEFERINDIEFHQNQRDAVKAAAANGVTVITGGPGTGKTTIVKCIAYIFEHRKIKTEFCSPTGRAAKRLAESTGKEAKTIHRLLGTNAGGGQASFTFNQFNKLDCDAIIVDEVSMVDVMVMSYLLRALERGTKVILVGDKDQLPSVSAGNVLADIIASGVVDARYLTQIYRQAENSLIITNAHIINSGKMPKIDNKSKDFFIVEKLPDATMTDTVVDLVASRLPGFCGINGTDIQVLGPLKSGVAGVENLNKKIQAKLNPFSPLKKEIRVGDTLFRAGDRVMQTVNDYQLVWTRADEKGAEKGEGVFNGDIGFITSIDNTQGITEITFDDNRVAEYTTLDLFNLQLAYAITIHKSQGSEFDVLVIALTNGPPTILNKNLLYTAVTRAKKTVVLVSSKKILGMTVRNNYIAERLTMLGQFLAEEKSKYETLFVTD